MADGIAITAGSGTTILTDDTGATGHAQVMKLAISTDGSPTLVPADGTAGLKVDLGADNDVTVTSGTVTANAGTNLNTSALALESGGNLASIKTGIDTLDNTVATSGSASPTNGLMIVGHDGTNAQRVSVATDGHIFVDAMGNVAHDSVDADNPVKMGAKAIAGISTGTAVAAADRTDLYAGLDGVQITRPYCGLEDIVSARISDTAGASVAIIAAQGTGVKVYLTTVALYNSSATNVYADILDGATIKLTLPLPAYGGAVINLPIPLAGTANTAWNLDVSAATTTVYATAIGFKSKV